MPFGDIISQSKTYSPRSPGYYVDNTLSFGDPLNEYRIKGATESRDGLLRSTTTRVLQKDVTVEGETQRLQASVQLLIAVPQSGFTAAELDSLAEDISTFFTAGTITRLLQGES